ncbi:hypothetical protein [Flavobacterium aciduliphilum]|uniref:Uncharacterized protein n=1 Tax=Flavobacterium aciduliphilum TaxID=1101402 RepID=A0A328YEM8_9FLAO|nr:hypothetical protein [Flavobacterium aciduliphilum]RAR72458.1 hypothetical protein CLV55_10523 [Flavobacterium aciduliphilum]
MLKKIEKVDDLEGLFKDYKDVIISFYGLSNKLNPNDLCKIAITGSTYRSFIRNNPKNYGMSYYFKEVAQLYSDLNPCEDETRNLFFKQIENNTHGVFKNWKIDSKGLVKLHKVYNLYTNYWVAYNLKGNITSKEKSISKLKIPLDKYSLNYISNLYNNDNETTEDFILKSNLSMGKIESVEHYDSINKFLEKISEKISEKLGEKFYPIYIDIIQAYENNLNWYKINIERSKQI